jgi:hypothetical protein
MYGVHVTISQLSIILHKNTNKRQKFHINNSIYNSMNLHYVGSFNTGEEISDAKMELLSKPN